jgi:hypothetical protein
MGGNEEHDTGPIAWLFHAIFLFIEHATLHNIVSGIHSAFKWIVKLFSWKMKNKTSPPVTEVTPVNDISLGASKILPRKEVLATVPVESATVKWRNIFSFLATSISLLIILYNIWSKYFSEELSAAPKQAGIESDSATTAKNNKLLEGLYEYKLYLRDDTFYGYFNIRNYGSWIDIDSSERYGRLVNNQEQEALHEPWDVEWIALDKDNFVFHFQLRNLGAKKWGMVWFDKFNYNNQSHHGETCHETKDDTIIHGMIDIYKKPLEPTKGNLVNYKD